MNYHSGEPLTSPLTLYIPPDAKWWFLGTIIIFVIAIHLHAVLRK